jgi:hypothetical protein
MKSNEILNEFYDISADHGMIMHKEDTRRPRLTLRHVNKLKKIRKMKRIEDGKRMRNIPKIYNKPQPEGM